MTDVLREILRHSRYKHWTRICFLTDQQHKWLKVLLKYNADLQQNINSFSDSELYLWLQGREFRTENIMTAFNYNRQDIYHRFVIPERITHYMAIACSIHGHLDFLKWLSEISDIDIPYGLRYMLPFALGNEHFHIIKWIRDRYDLNGDNLDIDTHICHAAGSNNLKICKWLVEEFTIKKPIVIYACEEAAILGHLRIVKWFTGKFNLNRKDIRGGWFYYLQKCFV